MFEKGKTLKTRVPRYGRGRAGTTGGEYVHFYIGAKVSGICLKITPSVAGPRVSAALTHSLLKSDQRMSC